MSALPGGRLHCVILYGVRVPVDCELLYPHTHTHTHTHYIGVHNISVTYCAEIAGVHPQCPKLEREMSGGECPLTAISAAMFDQVMHWRGKQT